MERDHHSLEVDYIETTKYFHALAEIRFKLLALLPLATGSALFLVDKDVSAPAALAIGLLGFAASFGITCYDQRNTQLYDRMQRRAKMLEAELGFLPFFSSEDVDEKSLEKKELKNYGGAFLDRPRRSKRLLWTVLMWHDLGLAIVYSSTMAGWSFLAGDAVVRLYYPNFPAGAEGLHLYPRVFSVALLVWTIIYVGLLLLDDPTDEQSSLPVRVRKKVWPERGVSVKKGYSHAFIVFGAGAGGSACLGILTGLDSALNRLLLGLVLGGGLGMVSALIAKAMRRAHANTTLQPTSRG